MSDWFDRLAKTLASGGSRRDALKLLGGALAGGLLTGFTGKARAEDEDDKDKDDNDKDDHNEEINEACEEYCEACPRGPGGTHGKCIKACKAFLRSNPKGKLCGTCTAKNPFTGCASGATCCAATKTAAAFCTNTGTDAKNCGACGNVCTGTTPACCKSKCADLATDNNNCGKCGNVCAAGTTCKAGVCG